MNPDFLFEVEAAAFVMAERAVLDMDSAEIPVYGDQEQNCAPATSTAPCVPHESGTASLHFSFADATLAVQIRS
jgi:hypothetical protein